MEKIKYIVWTLLSLFLLTSAVNAEITLDNLYFNPAIVAAGDNVDIVIQFRETQTPFTDVKIGSEEYTYKVSIRADDDLTREFVTIIDSQGDDLKGTLYSNQLYNKVFRVKVSPDAPAANYQFELAGQWYKNGVALDSVRSLKFEMPVKKEGIVIDLSTVSTNPSAIRPGDKVVEITGFLENVGEKDAKSVEVVFNLPDGISSSYSNNNRIWLGRLNAGESRQVTFYVDVDEATKSGLYNLNYDLTYMDLDNNDYAKEKSLDLVVKSRAYLEVVKVEGSGLAGDTGVMKVWIKNTGEQSAEAVDVRILKQNSQPFEMDVRSDYIGELMPGEEGLAIFEFSVNSDAAIKEHDFKLMIRARGDSDEGDDTIYTYNRRASFEVTGVKPNYLMYVGVALSLLVLMYIVFRKKKGGRK